MMMSCQHTALLLQENANEAESSARFSPKNAIYFVSELIIFQKVESDTSENFGWPRSDGYQSMHELNVAIVKSYFDPNKFREYFI